MIWMENLKVSKYSMQPRLDLAYICSHCSHPNISAFRPPRFHCRIQSLSMLPAVDFDANMFPHSSVFTGPVAVDRFWRNEEVGHIPIMMRDFFGFSHLANTSNAAA